MPKKDKVTVEHFATRLENVHKFQRLLPRTKVHISLINDGTFHYNQGAFSEIELFSGIKIKQRVFITDPAAEPGMVRFPCSSAVILKDEQENLQGERLWGRAVILV